MPTYDYECRACDHKFEHYQSITAKPLKKCPSCGARRVVRLMGTGGGIIFKGSGFYQTDYRSEQYKKAASKENGSGDNNNAAAENKPAAKSTDTGSPAAGKSDDS